MLLSTWSGVAPACKALTYRCGPSGSCRLNAIALPLGEERAQDIASADRDTRRPGASPEANASRVRSSKIGGDLRSSRVKSGSDLAPLPDLGFFFWTGRFAAAARAETSLGFVCLR